MILAALGVAATFGGGCDTRGTTGTKVPESVGKCWQTISEGGKTTQKEIVCPGGSPASSTPATTTSATPAPTYPGGGGTSTSQPATTTTPTPTPAPQQPGTTLTRSAMIDGGGGNITVTIAQSSITGPFAGGQDQASTWNGLRAPANQVGNVRPFVAGDYLGSPGWSTGVTVNPNLLGTFSGDANSGTISVKLPTAADSGQGGNIAFARWDGSNWIFVGWLNSSPPISNNFARFNGTNTKFSWSGNALKVADPNVPNS